MKIKFLKYIADLRFAIFILLLISFCSIIGTIIEQDQSLEIYKLNYPLNNKLFGFLSWESIVFFGFDHVYKTWWFLILILIFGISLSTCTFLQQFPTIKLARRCQFIRLSDSFKQLKLSTILTKQSCNKIILNLKLANYSLFQQKNILYCYKGLIGRIAPIVVHFSMILILLGTIVGSFGGFKAQEVVPKTENFHIQNIFNNGWLTKIPNISSRVNDFWITYSKNKTIGQFYSDISILDINGNEIKRQTSYVNSPVIYNNIYFYQTDWNLIGLRVKYKTNQINEYPLFNRLNNKAKIWLTWIPSTSDFKNGFILIIDNLQGYCSVYNKQGQFIGNFEINENLNKDQNIQLADILSSTGLQIKTDPSIPLIYIGFLFLMISTLISYTTYSQIWICQNKSKVFIGGNTNRATFEFELEFFNYLK
uniref:Cytochrome c biogenesis protein n=1 Tax=Thalassionema bacillare TaxID=426664 RepID=UPI001EDD9E41|nr:Cytochrome c biogenesis protein [Thalassionema bacillare]UHY40462.1 Cytochrome c biogenesis protein [Thalassionema bacillare]UHY40849.1 Cytochrome c biogenesis protein [Thalassionema bacillare]UHY41107.1 Cytochrome c biogenesis protein [Thalassionema bacillare]